MPPIASKTALILLCLFLAIACAGCEPGQRAGSTADTTAPSAMTAPIVKQTSLSGNFWTTTAYNDPDVHRSGDGYVMYFSRNTEDIYADKRLEPVSIFRAISSDGLVWTAEKAESVALGSATDWDYNKAETPSVVYFKGTYHLYYSGGSQNDSPAAYKIGHATSADGIKWMKEPANPVLKPSSITGLPNVLHVAEPGAVVYDGKIRLYFTVTSQRTGAGPSARMSIWCATSDDGTVFSTPKEVLSQGALYPAAEGYCGYSTPSAISAGSGIQLYYDVYKHTGGAIAPDEQIALHRAVSPDGEHFTEDAAPILKREDSAWTAREIRGGSEIAENGIVRMWFSGDNYATANGKWSGGMSILYAELAQ
jgi:predicted GH43/DUF377 family glycosyl hydrolase